MDPFHSIVDTKDQLEMCCLISEGCWTEGFVMGTENDHQDSLLWLMKLVALICLIFYIILHQKSFDFSKQSQ